MKSCRHRCLLLRLRNGMLLLEKQVCFSYFFVEILHFFWFLFWEIYFARTLRQVIYNNPVTDFDLNPSFNGCICEKKVQTESLPSRVPARQAQMGVWLDTITKLETFLGDAHTLNKIKYVLLSLLSTRVTLTSYPSNILSLLKSQLSSYVVPNTVELG